MSIIKNAQVQSVDVRFDQGFILTCWIHLTYDGTGQGFGGFVLGGKPNTESRAREHAQQPNIAADFIASVMAVCDVDSLNECAGKVIRVKKEDEFGAVLAIGHAIKDFWYTPAESPAFKATTSGRESQS